MMTYDEFEARLYELLDQRRPLDSDAELLAAAARTPEYQELLTAVTRLLETTAQLPLPTTPGAELNARVLAELRAGAGLANGGLSDEDRVAPTACDPPAMIPVAELRGTRGATFAALVLTTAAALLLGFFIWTGQNETPPVAAVPEAASVDVPATTSANDARSPDVTDLATGNDVVGNEAAGNSAVELEPAAPPELGTVAREASDRYRDLACETQKSLAEIALLLPGVSKTRVNGGDAAPAAAADGVTSEETVSAAAGTIPGDLVAQNSAAGDWMAQFQESFRPLTDSSMGAFTSLLKGLPGGQGTPSGQGISGESG